MTLTIHKNMRGDGKGGFEYDKTWHITPLWIRVLKFIGDGRDTPAKLFGVEGDVPGMVSEIQFQLAGVVLRDMTESEVIEWTDKRRLKLVVTDMGRAVLDREHLVRGRSGQEGSASA